MAGGCGALQHPDQQEVEGEHEDEAREEREEGGDVVCEQRLELILPHHERGRLDALPVLLHPRVDPRLAQRRQRRRGADQGEEEEEEDGGVGAEERWRLVLRAEDAEERDACSRTGGGVRGRCGIGAAERGGARPKVAAPMATRAQSKYTVATSVAKMRTTPRATRAAPSRPVPKAMTRTAWRATARKPTSLHTLTMPQPSKREEVVVRAAAAST